MTPRLESLLDRLGPVVREEMLKVCVPNCCIATVTVLRTVFQHHGFDARAIPVTVVIRNRKLVEALAKGMVFPSDPKALHAKMKATGAWSVGIVPESAQASAARGYPGYGGHLVCHVQDALVDASLAQANRPEYGITMPPFVVVEADIEFLAGQKAMLGEINGCEVTYTRLRDATWRKAPDWKHGQRYRETINRIIARTKP